MRLLPAKSEDEPLHCELITTKFDEAPDYEPISYAWGEKPEQESILGNEHLHSISSSLSYGLKRVGLTDRPRMLWADGRHFVTSVGFGF
jgi:hypothetical protein